MTTNRAISIGGLVILTVAALVSGGIEAALWVGGASSILYGLFSAMLDL